VGDFSAVYVKLDGPEEIDLGQHFLGATSLDAAIKEARARAPEGANSIKICREGQVERRLMIASE
jgi:imidazolonepropionase-like amidohydrolase